MQDKQTHENTKLTSIRIPIELYEKIEKSANENHRSNSGQIRYIIEQYFKIKES